MLKLVHGQISISWNKLEGIREPNATRGHPITWLTCCAGVTDLHPGAATTEPKSSNLAGVLDVGIRNNTAKAQSLSFVPRGTKRSW